MTVNPSLLMLTPFRSARRVLGMVQIAHAHDYEYEDEDDG